VRSTPVYEDDGYDYTPEWESPFVNELDDIWNLEEPWESPFVDDLEYDRREQMELLNDIAAEGEEIRRGLDDYDACDDRGYY